MRTHREIAEQAWREVMPEPQFEPMAYEFYIALAQRAIEIAAKGDNTREYGGDTPCDTTAIFKTSE